MSDRMDKITEDHIVAFRAIQLAFLEIRISDNLEQARSVADVFHNIPGMIMNGESIETIKGELKMQSERHNISALISNIFRDARKFAANMQKPSQQDAPNARL